MKTFVFASCVLANMLFPAEASAERQGAYAGVSVGIADQTFKDPSNSYSNPQGTVLRGFVPSLTAGYNFAVGDLVLGVEVTGAKPQGSGVYTHTGSSPITGTVDLRRVTKSEWEGSLSGRVGSNYGPWSYGFTGGYKLVHARQYESYTYSNKAPDGFATADTGGGAVFGLDVGYAVSRSVSIGIRAEKSSVRFHLPVKGGNGSETQQLKSNSLRSRVIFTF